MSNKTFTKNTNPMAGSAVKGLSATLKFSAYKVGDRVVSYFPNQGMRKEVRVITEKDVKRANEERQGDE